MRTLLLVMASLAAVLPAQQLSQLSGTVTDPSGAVVVGAKVRLESLTKGVVVRETVTEESGRYMFAQILPDRYKLVASAPGLQEITVGGIVVQVATPARYDIAFQAVGSVVGSVTVTEDVAQVNTVDASLGNVLGTRPILQLPSYARNVARLLSLQPGVTESGSVNGGKSDQANVTLDGIDVNEQMERTSFTSVLRVTLDSVEEFRTTTTNAGAEMGRSSGAQVSLVTKSGTNDTHGSVYWYHRNTVTAANTFFNNASNVTRPVLLINIPGASIGGPVKKNRLFYFFNWENRSERSEMNVERVVPSALLREGSVVYRNRAGVRTTLTPDRVRILDPRAIGANRAVLDLFRSYPMPNSETPGDGLNFFGYRFTAPLQRRWNTYISRFDYQLSTNHNLFFRGQLQNDRELDEPQFPGDPPNSIFLRNAKGVAIGYNAVLSNHLVSSFRYGFTRLSRESTGNQNASYVTFRGLDDRNGFTTGLWRKMPLHQFTEDLTWTHGKHSVQFGAVGRLITNQSRSYLRSFHFASTNVSTLRGTGSDILPTDVLTADRTAAGDALAAVLGLVSEVTANWNYNIKGDVLAVGAPNLRDFRNNELEMYVQDSWRVRKDLTLTLGLRWSLMPPVHEANGQQISTNIPLGTWFDTRGNFADLGRSQEEAGRIVFLSADDPKSRPLYPFYKKNFAPRVAVAYAPTGQSGLRKWLFGNSGKSSIRAGWGMFYDIIGQPLARTYDLSAFGFATSLTNPAGRLTATTAPRFTGLYDIPPALLRPAPKGGFPQQYPDDLESGFAITNSIDDRLKIPYTMNMNLTLGREFQGGWFIQGSYVGRMSRRSLMNRDLAMPTNLRDPVSGQSYFEAASQMALLVNARTPVASVPRVPFFENFYSNLRTSARSASQMVYGVASQYPNDFMTTLSLLDEYCDPDCGRLGPNMMMNPQFSSLSAWSSIAGGNYHSMQWTLRKRFSSGLSLDFNYTFAKSQDLASVEENGGEFAGFLVNSWDPSQRRGVSDYDQRHVWNMWWVYELPFGKGRKMLGAAGRPMDMVVGGWQVAGIWTQSTELPWSAGNGRNWPTNWQITTLGTPVGATTPSTKTKNAPAVSGVGGPNVWADPARTLAEWQYTLPGQSGSRNTVRVDGLSNFDLNVSKRFQMPYRESHSIQFRWETFNLWNQVRFTGADLRRVSTANWGKYTEQLNTPRQMQFALRYEF
ncbi:MAG: carboxypeptidase regulatory-like domain-containing protein [Acidobacteria bacterium]|nr:carboxypeptidase regulatory-like domain-containing protein [Acidobacteriota bacterium]